MRKLLYILGLLIISFSAKAQYPTVSNIGADSTLTNAKGGFKGRLIVTSFSDTTSANATRLSQYSGALIAVGDSLWQRNSTATKWNNFGRGGAFSSLTTNNVSGASTLINNVLNIPIYQNLALNDLTQTSRRIYNSAGFTTQFIGADSFVINRFPTALNVNLIEAKLQYIRTALPARTNSIAATSNGINIQGIQSGGSSDSIVVIDVSGNLKMVSPSIFGGGTVTSVGLSLPSEFTVSGSPVTSSGTLTGVWANESAYYNFGNNTGSTAIPHFYLNNFTDSIKRSNDSIFRRVNGNFIFQYKLPASGTGTVTNFSGVDNQGVSWSVSNPTTTPAATLTLGALTGVISLNGLVVTANNATITTGNWNGTPIITTYGGTGLTSYTSGDLLYYNSGTTLSKLAKGTNGQHLVLVSGFPAWQDTTLTVNSVSNSDGTLTVTPIRGDVVASIALTHPNTWTGQQTFNNIAQVGVGSSSTGQFKFANSTNGNLITMQAGTSVAWTLTLPTSAGTSGYLLQTDGSGVTSWVANTGGFTIGTFSNTSTAKGLDLTTGVLTLHSADGSNAGAVSTTTQTFAGNKTLTGITTTNDLNINNGHLLTLGNATADVAGLNTSSIYYNSSDERFRFNETDGVTSDWVSYVANVTGTSNRITSSGGENPVIDISSSYVGQSSITTLGIISTGTWNGTTIGVPYGGTGATTLASNGVLYGNGTSAVQALAVNSSATLKVLSQTSSGAPVWTDPSTIITTIPNLQQVTNVGNTTTNNVILQSVTSTDPILKFNANDLGFGNSASMQMQMLGSSEFDMVIRDSSSGFITNSINLNIGGENEYNGLYHRWYQTVGGSGLATELANLDENGLRLGVTGVLKGVLKMAGNTSGLVTIQPASIAGTWTWTIPTGAGSAGYVMKTNGSGVTYWGLDSLGGTGTVTSVALTVPSIFSVSGSPITTNGTFAITANATTGDIIYASATNTYAKRAIGSTGDILTVSGGLPVWSSNTGFIFNQFASQQSGAKYWIQSGRLDSTLGINVNPETIPTASRLAISNINDHKYQYIASSYEEGIMSDTVKVALLGNTVITNSSSFSASLQRPQVANYGSLVINNTGALTLLGTKGVYAGTVGQFAFRGTANVTNDVVASVEGISTFANSGNVSKVASFYALPPYQEAGLTSFTGVIADYAYLWIPDLSLSDIASHITNRKAIWQLGTTDTSLFAGQIKLSGLTYAANYRSVLMLDTVTSLVKKMKAALLELTSPVNNALLRYSIGGDKVVNTPATVDSLGNIIATNVTLKHLIGNSSTPSIARGTNADAATGSASTITITGTDLGGIIDIQTSGVITTVGNIANVTFATAYTATPVVVVSNGDGTDLAAGAQWSITNLSTTGFTLRIMGVVIGTASDYKANFIVVGK